MKRLVLHHNFENKRCLIVGGGAVAERRARRLIDAGGKIDIVAKQIGDDLRALIEQHHGAIHLRAYRDEDLTAHHYALVVAATDQRAVNRAIKAHANRCGVAVNVADDSAHSDIIFPLMIEREPIAISVACGATSPTLTRLLGRRIDSLLPHDYGALARLFGEHRQRAREMIPERAARLRFWEDILHGAVGESVLSGQAQRAAQLLEEAFVAQRDGDGNGDSANKNKSNNTSKSHNKNENENKNKPHHRTGEVYLIGAGPGDPDLLTLRAHRLLMQSDVVLYDRLVAPEILTRIRDAELVYVGKRRASHAVAQRDINEMLIAHAQRGRRVARLKGGDPFIFGRGGEEIEQLAAANIAFQIIPGVTAANGCACYAGIPLTHRDYAQSVRFVTGQLRDGAVELDWASLVAPGQTLVFYMSLLGLPLICEHLRAAGLDADTPAALIEKGTMLQQKVHLGTITTLRTLDRAAIRAPTLLIVGAVVELHDKLRWFECE